MKIAICDDNNLFCNKVSRMITSYMSERNLDAEIRLFHSGSSLVAYPNYDWDAIFLDISMDGLDGIATARKIRERNQETLIVFVTSFIEFSLQGYEVEAVRYILKEQLEQQFRSCMDYVVKRLGARQNEITLQSTEGVQSVAIEKILFIESNNHRLTFHVLKSDNDIENLHIYEKLDNYEPLFAKHGFLRTHKSYIVNMKYISRIKDYCVYLRDGRALPIPKAKYANVKRQYVLYKGAK